MKAQELKAICKANAELLNATVGQINVAKVPQLEEWYNALLTTEGAVLPNTVTNEETQNEIESIVTDADANTKVLFSTKGEPYTVIGLPYIGRSANGSFKFSFKDKELVTNDDNLRTLSSHGRLAEGTVIFFDLDSIAFSSQYNTYLGNPNKSANPDMMKVIEFRQENIIERKDQLARFVLEGMSYQEARDLQNSIIAEEAKATRVKRTLQFD